MCRRRRCARPPKSTGGARSKGSSPGGYSRSGSWACSGAGAVNAAEDWKSGLPAEKLWTARGEIRPAPRGSGGYRIRSWPRGDVCGCSRPRPVSARRGDCAACDALLCEEAGGEGRPAEKVMPCSYSSSSELSLSGPADRRDPSSSANAGFSRPRPGCEWSWSSSSAVSCGRTW